MLEKSRAAATALLLHELGVVLPVASVQHEPFARTRRPDGDVGCAGDVRYDEVAKPAQGTEAQGRMKNGRRTLVWKAYEESNASLPKVALGVLDQLRKETAPAMALLRRVQIDRDGTLPA